jgi:internalin A
MMAKLTTSHQRDRTVAWFGCVTALLACSVEDVPLNRDENATSHGGNGGESVDVFLDSGGESGAPHGDGAENCQGVLSFPDPALESAIRNAIDKPDGSIALDDVAHLEELRFDGVASLTGLECLTSLAYLEMVDSAISDLAPLSQLTSLTYLAANDSAISDLTPLAGLTSLTTLYLNRNSVSDLTPLSGLTWLEYLELGENAIGDLTPLEGLAFIWVLKLGDNAISDVSPLASLVSLGTLDLSNNAIRDVSPLSTLTSLSILYLHGNAITDLGPLVANFGLDRMDQVSLYYNPIDCDEQASNLGALVARGVLLDVDCP